MARNGLHYASLILVLVAFPAAWGQQAESLRATFSSPAEAEGNLTARELRGVLVLFDGQEASVDLLFEGSVQAVTHTIRSVKHDVGIVSHGQEDVPSSAGDSVSYGDELSVHLQPLGVASLYVEAESIQVEGVESAWEIWRSFPGGCLAFQARDTQDDMSFRADGSKCAERIVVVLRITGDQGAVPFELQAKGLQRAEWHNMATACPGECPEGGLRDRQGAQPAPGYSAILEEYRYVDVTAQGGHGNATGLAHTLVAQGPRIGLDGTGGFRLPQVHSSGTCENLCGITNNNTLSATGTFTFTHLEPAEEDDRLQTGLTGAFTSVQLDERTVAGLPVDVQVAVGVVATATLLVLLVYFAKPLVGLFSRIDNSQILEHPGTRHLLERIMESPGKSFRGLSAELGWPDGKLAYHLQRLQRGGHVLVHPHRNTTRYFENNGRYEGRWKALVTLQEDGYADLHRWLLEHPGASQVTVLEHSAQLGRGRRWTQYALNALKEARLVESMREGRTVHYTAKPAS